MSEADECGVAAWCSEISEDLLRDLSAASP